MLWFEDKKSTNEEQLAKISSLNYSIMGILALNFFLNTLTVNLVSIIAGINFFIYAHTKTKHLEEKSNVEKRKLYIFYLTVATNWVMLLLIYMFFKLLIFNN